MGKRRLIRSLLEAMEDAERAPDASILSDKIYRDAPNEMRENQALVRMPVSDIEHGESAMDGGRLTWPTAPQLIREYAEMDTELPPIEIMSYDGQKAMVADGSHRLEAAKLRGQKFIDAYVNIDDLNELPTAKVLRQSQSKGLLY